MLYVNFSEILNSQVKKFHLINKWDGLGSSQYPSTVVFHLCQEAMVLLRLPKKKKKSIKERETCHNHGKEKNPSTRVTIMSHELMRLFHCMGAKS